MEQTNSLIGGLAVPTIGCYVQQLHWEDKDVFCVPNCTFHEHVNTGVRPVILFGHTGMPVIRALDLYLEEAHPSGRR